MKTFEKSVDVAVPLQTAYNQWTQFEEFPRFMEGVERIEQLDNRTTHWVTKIGGVEREFDAVIAVQEPDHIITWNTTPDAGEQQAGRVTFEPIDPDHTRVTLVMGWEPQGAVEKAGGALGVVERRVEGDLKRFRSYVEERGTSSGAWRGRIEPGQEPSQEQPEGQSGFTGPGQSQPGYGQMGEDRGTSL